VADAAIHQRVSEEDGRPSPRNDMVCRVLGILADLCECLSRKGEGSRLPQGEGTGRHAAGACRGAARGV